MSPIGPPHRRARRIAGLAAIAMAVVVGAGRADEKLNPKDALAPIFRENPRQSDPRQDRARLRNEGIAHLEGGLTLDRAITSFEAAYDIGHQPVDAFDLALVYLKQNKLADARAWTEKALDGNADFAPGQYLMGLLEKLDGHADAAKARWTKANELYPTDATLHYQLAMLAGAEKDEHTFLQELLRALELDPDHKSSLYQMYRYYQGAGNKEMAVATLKRFNAVKASERFSRKLQPLDESRLIEPLRDDQARNAVGFAFIDTPLSMKVTRPDVPCRLTRLTTVTVIAAPAHEDLIGICADGGIVRIAGGQATALGTLGAPPADVRVDWLDGQGPRIITAGPTGVRVSGPLDGSPPHLDPIDPEPARRLVLADIEHDGSLDILTDASPAPLAKVGGAYKRQPAVYGHSALGEALRGDGPVRVADLRRRGMADLVVGIGPDVQIITDGADGYRDGPRLHIADTGAVSQIELADLGADGALDLVAASGGTITIVWGAGHAEAGDGADGMTRLPAGGGAPVRFAIADLNNDGRRDIVTIDADGHASAFVNKGPRDFERRALTADPVPAPASDLIAFDESRDGLIDIAYIDTTGALVVLRNTTANAGGSIDVLLNGRRSPPTGQLTQLELRKGQLYSYAQSTGGLVHFGLGREEYAEIVRLEWPNGFVENKIKVDAATEPYVYLESERIAGSCPTIFVRGQDGFRYVTDAMITTAIGILEQRGAYFEFGDQEHVVIPPGMITEADGRLDIRVTEELRETTYIDRATLLAVDHPAGARLATTERLAPPSPEAGPLYLARRLVPAARATFEGRDVTDDLARRDGRYADVVHRTRNPGFADLSVLELELGDDVAPERVGAVYATGWFLAFDSTAVIGAFKGEAPAMQFPELQQLVDGKWESVGYIGIPAGQNRTAVLTLNQPLRSRHLRILSGFSVYWDEIAFSVDGAAPITTAQLPLESATLRFHGFSKPVSRDPEIFSYEDVEYGMLWSPMRGNFTNYGDVTSMLRDRGGAYVVIGGGDEIALSFAAPAAPPAPGFERSFVLVLDGHVKDADRYTAKSDSVEPMPYTAMTRFPPAPGDTHPAEDAGSVAVRQRTGFDFTLSNLQPGGLVRD